MCFVTDTLGRKSVHSVHRWRREGRAFWRSRPRCCARGGSRGPTPTTRSRPTPPRPGTRTPQSASTRCVCVPGGRGELRGLRALALHMCAPDAGVRGAAPEHVVCTRALRRLRPQVRRHGGLARVHRPGHCAAWALLCAHQIRVHHPLRLGRLQRRRRCRKKSSLARTLARSHARTHARTHTHTGTCVLCLTHACTNAAGILGVGMPDAALASIPEPLIFAITDNTGLGFRVLGGF